MFRELFFDTNILREVIDYNYEAYGISNIAEQILRVINDYAALTNLLQKMFLEKIPQDVVYYHFSQFKSLSPLNKRNAIHEFVENYFKIGQFGYITCISSIL